MKEYFSGWYFRCQSDTQTLAIIPARHYQDGEKNCSIQVITKKGAWNIPFPYQQYWEKKKGLKVSIGHNRFSERGIRIHIHTKELQMDGVVRFGQLSPIEYDIMGPFSYIPHMECRHKIVSMKHSVTGTVRINGEIYRFSNDLGYIEGDCGYSFPKQYMWTQSHFEEGSIMASVAHIPFLFTSFTGIISVIQWRGKEYRFASYLGAKVQFLKDGVIILRQGKYKLIIELLEKNEILLYAPQKGNMKRTIKENIEAEVKYTLRKGHQILFSFVTTKAAFEYEYEQ